MKKVRHDNVVGIQYYGVITELDILYAVMELCIGGELGDRYTKESISRRGAVAEETMWRWMTECTAGVQALHDLKPTAIIHRDLKPANIFLSSHDDEHAHCKLGDLGLARDVENKDESILGTSDERRGTPSYMAPELAQGEKFSTKSDIWGLVRLRIAPKRPILSTLDFESTLFSAQGSVPPRRPSANRNRALLLCLSRMSCLIVSKLI